MPSLVFATISPYGLSGTLYYLVPISYRPEIEGILKVNIASKKAAYEDLQNHVGTARGIAMTDYSEALHEFCDFVVYRIVPERFRDK